jgi:hypothetical protein
MVQYRVGLLSVMFKHEIKGVAAEMLKSELSFHRNLFSVYQLVIGLFTHVTLNKPIIGYQASV